MINTNLSEFEHRRIHQLLPWWVNGTLNAHDIELVESHLEHCEICQEECDMLRRCNEALVEEPLTVPDVDAAFARVAARIDSRGSVAGAGEVPSESIAGNTEQPEPRVPLHAAPGLTKWMSMAAAAVLLLGLALMWRPAVEPVVGEGEYRVLSSSAPSSEALYLEVRFHDEHSAQDGVLQLREFLDDPKVMTGWEKTDAQTYLVKIDETTTPETLSRVLAQLATLESVSKAALVSR